MIDENNFLKLKTVCKSCYNKNRRKNTSIEKKLIKSTTTMFQLMRNMQIMRIMLVLLLGHETLVRHTICLKC